MSKRKTAFLARIGGIKRVISSLIVDNSIIRTDKERVKAYVAQNKVVKIHLGCGPVILDGWLNCDYDTTRGDNICQFNLLCPFPIPDNTVDFYYMNHTFEHFSLSQGFKILLEINRALKPGGALRVGIPALDKLYTLYSKPNQYSLEPYGFSPIYSGYGQSRMIQNMCTYLNEMFRNHGHQFLYDLETISILLTESGFRNIEEESHGVSRFPDLNGLEDDDFWLNMPGERPEWRKVMADETLYVTCVK